MMHIEHINLVVRDLAQTLAFYELAFPQWRIRSQGSQDWHGVQMNWCHFGDDYHYITFNDNGTGIARDLTGSQIGLAHIGFEVSNIEALITRMDNAGFEPNSTGADHAFRSNAYFLDPNGIEVEFVQYFSDIPSQRNSLQVQEALCD